MEAAILRSKEGEISGGEDHYIAFDLGANNSLVLEVDSMCYGAYTTFFTMEMYAIGPDELEKFANDLILLTAEMRKRDAERT